MTETIDGLAFSVEGLRRDADEIELCGGGNEAACMRWAAGEIERLRGVIRVNAMRWGQPSDDEVQRIIDNRDIM